MFYAAGRLWREVGRGVGPKMGASGGLKIRPWFQIYRTSMSEMEVRGWTVSDRSMPLSGRRKPEASRCGTAAWRVVVGDRQGGGADGRAARRAPAPSQHAQHYANRGRCPVPRTLPAHLFRD